jgi:calcineurin-like phosphoesterase
VGPRDSIIGVQVRPVIERFLTQLPIRFGPVEKGPAILNSVLIGVDESSGRAERVVRIDREIGKHDQ